MLKIFMASILLFGCAFGDFYIVSGDKKVKMTPLRSGRVDFSTFNNIAHINRNNKELHIVGNEIAFNHRHLNFRLVSIGLKQVNYTLTEWSKKVKNSSDTYYINFDNYTRDDGMMLQLFYKNRWYGVVLGDPLIILHTLFLQLKINSDRLDLDKAIIKIKEARRAFPLDDKLKMVEIELDSRKVNEPEKEKNKQIKIIFK